MDRWIEIDPAYLPEHVRAARDIYVASRKAAKQSEARYKAAGGITPTERGIEREGGEAPCSNCREWTSHKILHTEERELDEVMRCFN